MFVLCYVLLSVLTTKVGSSASLVSIDEQDGGYRQVVVSISSKVSQFQAVELVSSLKEILRNTSKYLHESTNQRAWLKEVTIILPKHWDPILDLPTEPVGLERHENADIRVDEPNRLYGESPYTQQTKGCGKIGEYVHITPEFLLGNSSFTRFGDPGRVMVHEWAHLRYGVFDEYGYPGDPIYSPFYFKDEDTPVLTSCTNKRVVGDKINYNTGGRCVENPRTGLPERDCAFIASLTKNDDVESSLMDLQYLPNVRHFCGQPHSHNKDAPNKHNNLCEGRSVWQVIESTEDFQKIPKIGKVLDPTDTKFRLVKEKSQRYVLVMDISNKRSDYKRDFMFYVATSKALEYYFPIGSQVGVVVYSNEDRTVIKANLTELKNQNDRKRISLTIPDFATAAQQRCVLCGIKKALEALKSETSGANIILLTDGNMRPSDMEEVKIRTRNAKVRLFVLLYPHPGLRGLDWEGTVRETNGKTFVIDEPRKNKDGSAVTVMELEAAYLSILSETLPKGKAPVTVIQHVKELSKQIARSSIYQYQSSNSQGSLVTGSFSLDAPSALVFSIYYYERGYISEDSTTLEGPSKQFGVVDLIRHKFIRTVLFVTDYAENGTWNYKVIGKPPTQQPLIITATAIPRPNSDEQPISIRGWMNVEDEVDPTKTPVIIYAELKKGDYPVIGARVVVYVEIISDNPEQSRQPGPILLRDNGNGDSDITANDGVYSAYFTHFYSASRYTVKVRAEDNGQSFVNTEFQTTFSGANPMQAGEKMCCGSEVPIQQLKSTGLFSREYAIGSFNVISKIVDDSFPPARIGNLQIVQDRTNIPNPGGTLITLRWTAPGDDYDYGTASEYELRFSKDREDLVSRFEGRRVREDSSGQLITPREAGTSQSAMIAMPPADEDVIYYFAIRAKDENFTHRAKLSNIVQILVKKTPTKPTKPGYTHPPPTTVIATGKKQSQDNRDPMVTDWTIIIIVILSFLVFVIIIAAIIYLLFRRRKEPRRGNPVLMPNTIPTKHNNNKAHIVAQLGAPEHHDYSMSPVQSWPASTLLNHYDKVAEARERKQPPPIMSTDHIHYEDGNSMSTVKHSDSKESIHSSITDKDEKMQMDTSPDLTSSTPSLTPSANLSLRRVTQV